MFNVFKRKSRSTSFAVPTKNSVPSHEVADSNRNIQTLRVQFGSDSFEEQLPKYGQNVQFKSFRGEETTDSCFDSTHLQPHPGNQGGDVPDIRLDDVVRKRSKNKNKSGAATRYSMPAIPGKGLAPPPPQRFSSLYSEDEDAQERLSHAGVDFSLIPPPPNFDNAGNVPQDASDCESSDARSVNDAEGPLLLLPPPSFESPSPSKVSVCSSDSGVGIKQGGISEDTSDSDKSGPSPEDKRKDIAQKTGLPLRQKTKPQVPEKPSRLLHSSSRSSEATSNRGASHRPAADSIVSELQSESDESSALKQKPVTSPLSEMPTTTTLAADSNTESEFTDTSKAFDNVERELDTSCTNLAVQSLLDAITNAEPVQQNTTSSFSSFRPRVQAPHKTMDNKTDCVKEETSITPSSGSSLNNTPCPTPPPRKNRAKSQKGKTTPNGRGTLLQSSSFEQTSFTEVSSDVESTVSSQVGRRRTDDLGRPLRIPPRSSTPRSSTPNRIPLNDLETNSPKVQLKFDSSLAESDSDLDQQLNTSFTSSLDSQRIILSGSFLDDSVLSSSDLSHNNAGLRRSTPGPDSSRERMVLVEEDYVPDVDSDSSVMSMPSGMRPWHATMSKSWHANLNQIPGDPGGYTFPGYVGSHLRRKDSVRSEASESTVTESDWHASAPTSWSAADVLEWCDTLDLQDVKQVLEDEKNPNQVTGRQLLRMTSRDLVDLGVSDEETRRMVLKEINNLRQASKPKAAASASDLRWNRRQSSAERRRLEASKERLREDLDSLQKLNNQQEQQLSLTLQELEAQQRLTDALLGNASSDYHQPLSQDRKRMSRSVDDILNHMEGATREPLDSYPSSLSGYSGLHRSSIASRGSSDVKPAPLIQWTETEVIEWMGNVGLEKFIPAFREHHITGEDLAGIDMQLLDNLEVTSTEDRELLLSKLYELQHPQSPLLRIKTAPASHPPPLHPTSATPDRKASSSANSSVRSAHSVDKPVIAAKPVVKKKISPENNQPKRSERQTSVMNTSGNMTPVPRDLQDGSSGGLEGDRRSKLQSQDSIEFLQEIALLHESLTERDGDIAQLQQQNSQLQKQHFEQEASLKQMIAALRQELQEKEEFTMTNMAALQQQVDRARLMQDPDQRVKILKGDLESLTNDIQTTEQTITQLSHQVESPVSGDNVDELKQQLEDEQLRLRALRQKLSESEARLRQAEAMVAKLKVPEEPVLFECLERDLAAESPKQLLAVEVTVPPSEGPGFIFGRSDSGLPVVKHVEDGRPVQKGDCLLEINGHRTCGQTEQTVSQYLREANTGTLKLLLLRNQQPIRDEETLEELHILKEDLSLAVMELETVQQENKDLTNELASHKKVTKKLQDSRDSLEQEVAELRRQVTESESQWRDLTSMLSQVKVKNKDISKILKTGSSSSTKSRKFDLENGTSDQHSIEPRDGLDWLQELVNGDSHEIDQVLAYDEYDDRLPLWECLRNAPKEEILQALKDHILESRQQKVYLDSLLSAVIDAAPQLLQHIDDKVAVPESVALKPHSEEFC